MSKQRGMSLAEVLVGVAIVGILIYMTVSLVNSATTSTRLTQDRQFGAQKAISIIEELKSIVATQSGRTIVVLDQYDDGAVTKPRLTVQGDPDNDPADDVTSGNISRPSLPTGWLYARQITILRLPGQSATGVRLARVKIFKNEKSGQRLLAEVATVIRTMAGPMPPTQVYDVYALQIENVPGWWVQMARLIPMVQGAVADLEARNPGLSFRMHIINKLSYGRDQEYKPYINWRQDSDQQVNSVYWYPGTLPPVDATRNPDGLAFYYDAQAIRARMRWDQLPAPPAPNPPDTINGYDADATGVDNNGNYNPFPYALADQWNHAMRYEDELALYNSRRDALYPNNAIPASLRGTKVYPNEEPTYRLLMEDMFQNPLKYTNAIMINLHGELFPFPPVRNYSDAAKDPEVVARRGIRVVTHPEQLTYGNGSDLKLRVYSYRLPYDGTNLPAPVITDYLTVPITIVLPGINVSAGVQVQSISGGVNQLTQAVTPGSNTTSRDDYVVSAVLVNGATPAGEPNAMYYTSAYDVSITSTVIKLFNSPLRSPCITSAGALSGSSTCGDTDLGLSLNGRLYGMEYVPSPVENLRQGEVPFMRNLAHDDGTGAGNTGPKNTARWIITIPNASINTVAFQNRVFRFETRIGDTTTEGKMYPAIDHPANLSTTYIWRGTDNWLYGNLAAIPPVYPHLPITERYQFQGDPRHSPYVDNKAPFTGTYGNPAVTFATGLVGPPWTPPATNRIGMGYNRYFDDFRSAGIDLAGGSATTSIRTGAGLTKSLDTWNGWNYTLGLAAPNDWFGIKKGQAGDGAHDDNWLTDGNPDLVPDIDFDPATSQGAYPLDVDVNRFYEVTRRVITSGRLVYTTMTGFSYYYIGLGGEIGYDSANGFPSSLPVHSRPFTGTNGTTFEQSISSGVKYIRRGDNGANQFWWGMSWLGELYPDDLYSTATGWRATGNLPTGTGVNEFRRVLRSSFYNDDDNATNPRPLAGLRPPRGTVFADTARRTWANGSTTLFWNGVGTIAFRHEPDDTPNQGSLGALGNQMQDPLTGYNFPLFNPVPARRPFRIDVPTGNTPDHFMQLVYGGVHPAAYQGRFYGDLPTPNTLQPASALVSLRDPDTQNVGFVVVNGLSPAGDAGTAFVGRWSFLSLIHSFLTSGLYAGSGEACVGCPKRTIQVPRVIITSPNVQTPLTNPPSINVTWAVTWKRWDDKLYTQTYDPSFTESTVVLYHVLMYSKDDGVTWFHAYDDSPAVPGRPPNDPDRYLPTDPEVVAGLTDTINTPAATFPEANYLIRVETYRTGYPMHYSFHQFRAFIQR